MNRTRLAMAGGILALGAALAWSGRYGMLPDSLSYLDLADAYRSGRWHEVINATWSPGYSWLVAVILWLLRPGPRGEIFALHLANFLMLVTAVAAFDHFWRGVVQSARAEDEKTGRATLTAAWVLGYAWLAWAMLDLVTLWRPSPDLGVAAVVFLGTGFLMHHAQRAPSLLSSAGFGALLALGYYVKTVLLVLSPVFLLVAVLQSGDVRRRVRGAVVSLVVLIALTLPFIVLLSRAKNRFTFGDSGRLTYAYMVSPGVFWRNWQGGASGTALHATRKLMSDPSVYEFAEPIPGTYPVWYDSSYWNDGLKPRFDFRIQAFTVVRNSFKILEIVWGSGALLSAALGLCVLGYKGQSISWHAYLAPLLIGFAGLGLYALVLPDPRYIASFLVLIAGAVVVRWWPSKHPRWATAVATATAIAVFGAIGLGAIRDTLRPRPEDVRSHLLVASELKKLGLSPGSEVGIIGEGSGAYWARMSRVRIITEIMASDAPRFWSASPQVQCLALHAMVGAGSKLVVAVEPPMAPANPWSPLGNTGFYVYAPGRNMNHPCAT